MLLSDLLLEKLNSNVELTKRIQLAKNVFISTDLKIAYKEEHILLWFLKSILDSKTEEEKINLIKGLCFCGTSEIMYALPSSGIQKNGKTTIGKYLIKIWKSSDNLDSDLYVFTFNIIKKFLLHFKSHPKQYIKLLFTMLHSHMSLSQTSDLLNLTFNIYKSGIIHEKFVSQLLKEDFYILFEKLDSADGKANVYIDFIQKMFFKKEFMTDYLITLHSICSNSEILVNNTLLQMMFSALNSIYMSDLNIDVKKQSFCMIFQSFAKSCDSEHVPVLQCFIALCHILGLEQNVILKNATNFGESACKVVNEKYFQQSFKVAPSIASSASYVIAKSLIDALSEFYPDMSMELLDSTYLAWFQNFVLSVVKNNQLTNVHLEFFCSCAELNTSIIEKNFTKILSGILKRPAGKSNNEDFFSACSNFLESMLKMYSKLQRTQKFMSKLLETIRTTDSLLIAKSLFSNNFIAEFSNITTLLSSNQSLSFMDEILNVLSEHCLGNLEHSSGAVNTLLVQVTCTFLTAFLCGVKILNHNTPKEILKSFVEKLQRLKEIAGRFGKALLNRTHDREIVQPFLSVCFYWGELQLLIMYYEEEYSETISTKDISPTDLSALHSYLNGEEWNVLAERVSNFGAVHCYQIFLKLILQKLRVLNLKKCYSLIGGETTSKYILSQLTSELYQHNIVKELTPEDFSNVLAYLSQKQSYILIEKLFSQIFDVQYGNMLVKWITGSMLLEQRNFVILSFVVLFRKICSGLNNLAPYENAVNDSCEYSTLEFINADYTINHENLNKFIDHINTLLLDVTVLSIDDNVKVEELKTCLEVFKCLPLDYMPGDIHCLGVASFIFLSFIFSNNEDLLSLSLFLLYSITLKTNKENQYPKINKGRCIKWLLQNKVASGDIRNLKYNMVKFLLKLCTLTDNGLMELKELVRLVKKQKQENGSRTLEQQIILYQDLGKCWVKARKRQHENDKISAYRGKLWKCIRKELERQNRLKNQTVDSEILVRAYGVELTRAIRLKKEENIVSLIKLNFNEFVDTAVAKVRNCSENKESYITFLTTIALHMPHIRNHVGEKTLKKIWTALKSYSETDWKFFYSIATVEEFKYFLFDLIKMWKKYFSGNENEMSLATYFTIWKKFFSIESNEKRLIYQKYVNRLFDEFSGAISKLNALSSYQIAQLFNFLQFCISNNKITLSSTVLDVIFDILYVYDYRNITSNQEFQVVFDSCVEAASWMLTTRAVSVKDKIHNIFQLFQKLLDNLVRRSNVSLELKGEDLLSLSACSHNMEKWTSKMINWDKDFSRVSVYFIGEIITSFVRVTVYPAVKDPLVNCINNFLKISDSHNVAHLERVLNPGSQQIFHGIYEIYKKYYKFTGRV